MNKRPIFSLLVIGSAFVLATLILIQPAAVRAQTFSCATVTEIPQAECGALVSLYANTNGSNWWDKTGWLVTSTPCDWYGVLCEDGHVQWLTLTGNQLSGRIPVELTRLDHLQGLYLEHNDLAGDIPPELGDLINLVELTLHGNRLSGPIPTALGNLQALQILSLAENELSGRIPESLGRLTQLQTLYLQDNFLVGEVPVTLGNLTNLRAIGLEGNQITGLLPGRLQDLLKKKIDLRSQPDMRAAIAQIEELLPAPGNCGGKSIDSLIFDTEALEISGTATISACHSWGSLKCPTWNNPRRECDVKASQQMNGKFTYGLETNRLSGNLDFGTIPLCSPAPSWAPDWLHGCVELADIKVDIERLQRAMEGDVVAMLELIPSAKMYENLTRNEYDRIRQSKWDTYGRDNVYFASREFVDWASAAKSVQWAAELLVTGGAAGAAIMAEVQSEALKEVQALTRWLQAKGVQEATRIARDLLSGKSEDYPYIALHWQTVKFESKRRVAGVDLTPWIPVRHGAFYFVWKSDTSADLGAGSSTSALARGSVIVERLNVRSGPGTNYPVIGTLSKNRTVDITGQNNGWWQIRFRHQGGEFGWISDKSGNTQHVTTQNATGVSFVAAPAPSQASTGANSPDQRPPAGNPVTPQPARPSSVNIVFKHSSKCVRTIDGDLRSLPIQIEQASCKPEYRFSFEQVPGASGYYYIKVALDRDVIGCLGVPDVVKRSFGNGAVKVKACAPTNEFMWRLTPLGGANSGWNLLKTKVDEAFCFGVENYDYYYSQPAARFEDKRLITVNWCEANDPWQMVSLRP